MLDAPTINYEALVARHQASEAWERFVDEVLAKRWLAQYRSFMASDSEIVEVQLNALTYLFDLGGGDRDDESSVPEERVVAVWGRSQPPAAPRGTSRLRGFLPNPERWSLAGFDRGHLVSHAAGGALDLNLVPQSAAVNRGRSHDGRLWRRMERHAATHPGTPLFVRPLYSDPSWTPAALECGLLLASGLWWHRFVNKP